MSIASLHTIPEDMKTSYIRVHSYQDKNLVGTFYNIYYGKEIAFGNLTRLLLLMEDMMDALSSPEASVQSRRFGNTPKQPEQISIKEYPQLQPEQEVIATFKVKVLFRRGASWQGTFSWAEKQEEVSFRSVLELVKLMDSALPQPEPCSQADCSEVADTG